jgi:DNA polymerase I
VSKPVILLDADVLRYQLAYSNSKSIDWDGDGDKVEVAVNPERALDACNEYIEEMVEKFGASDYVLALSCKQHNFRKDILPSYKDNRAAKPKPSLWYVLDVFLYSTFAGKIVERPTLEGDDILGLLATHPSPKRAPGARIVVSIDKDLQTIPCRLYNPNKPDIGVRSITQHDADLFWMKQVLTGDAVDNYTGIPGVGHKAADELLMPIHEALRDASPEEHLSALWAAVLHTYETKKPRGGDTPLGADAALVQARCARILRHGDYDHKTKEIRLAWLATVMACREKPWLWKHVRFKWMDVVTVIAVLFLMARALA